jgi:hypothetical protein
MTVPRFTADVTPQDRSLKIEALKGTQWTEAGDWRFSLENYRETDPAKLCDARLYARDLATHQGVIGFLRVVPSADPPNCHLVGGLGSRHLQYFQTPDAPR